MKSRGSLQLTASIPGEFQIEGLTIPDLYSHSSSSSLEYFHQVMELPRKTIHVKDYIV